MTQNVAMLLVLLTVAFCVRGFAADTNDQSDVDAKPAALKEPLPAAAKTIEEIKTAVEARKGFGKVRSVKFKPADREIIMFWYCPFSGLDSCYIHGYFFDKASDRWVLFWNKLIAHSHTLTVELSKDDTALIAKNTNGEEVLNQAIDKLTAPAEEKPAEKK